MSDHVQEISQTEFPKFIAASDAAHSSDERAQYVILDFYSTECPPCEALAPKYAALAEQFAGKVRFLKIFRQGNRELASQLGVSSSPTLLFYHNGQEVGERMTGDIKRSELKQRIEQLLSV